VQIKSRKRKLDDVIDNKGQVESKDENKENLNKRKLEQKD
tara:strand:+ start:413 stop:532 length:120 start_codon:yes stop_codon:yes gene_type:complete